MEALPAEIYGALERVEHRFRQDKSRRLEKLTVL